MSSDPIFRVIFTQEDQIYEVYAREVDEEAMMGFICIGELEFDERGGVVVDPSEEKLKREFEGVNRLYIPAHMLLRIDEMDDRRGVSKIKDKKNKGHFDNVREFPGTS